MIDPQGQANQWIRNMEGESKDLDNKKGKNNKKRNNNNDSDEENENQIHTPTLKIVKMNQSDFLRVVENAVQFGSPLLIENLPDYIDPVLNPVLQKKIVMIGNAPHLQIGDSQGEYFNKN